jgi:DNA polymerase III alpha subunit (gram-positive type)
MVNDLYVATDIESNGPSPGHHSMLSFASAAFLPDKTIVSTFARNLELLHGAKEHPETMAWWRTQQDAWRACRADPVQPKRAMLDYVDWLKALPGQPIFVAHPVAFDYPFMSWYLWEFAGEDPFERRSLDLSSYAAGLLSRPVTQCKKEQMPKHWFDKDFVHNHQALDDALGYAKLACNMLGERRPA